MAEYKLEVAGQSDDVAVLRAHLSEPAAAGDISLKMRPAVRRDFSVLEIIVTAAVGGVFATTFDVLKELVLSKLKGHPESSSPVFSLRINGDRIDISTEADIEKLRKRLSGDAA